MTDDQPSDVTPVAASPSDALAVPPQAPPLAPGVASAAEGTTAENVTERTGDAEGSGPAYTNQQIRIGSQRQADARFRPEVTAPQRRFRPQSRMPEPMRDLTPTKKSTAAAAARDSATPQTDPSASGSQADSPPVAEAERPPRSDAPRNRPRDAEGAEETESTSTLVAPTLAAKVAETVFETGPRVRTPLPSDLQQELDDMLAGVSLDEMISSKSAPVATPDLEPESRLRGRVAKIHRDDVFVDLGGRNQGIVPFHHFVKEPEVGQFLDVVVRRFLPEEGLYEISAPGASVAVQDWSELSEGLIVDAMITGHNKGGLECEVNKIRGFIPASQVSMYRVEDLEQFVGQKFACVVTEANPDKRNLVLSRRAVLEREQAESKAKLMAELAPGQVREGIVRRVTDFGAFVDLGGVDGLIHVSQMSWDRIKHPSEVLEVGQKVKAKIEKIDPATGKIGLSYRELFENPWNNVPQKYPATAVVKGVVSRIMDFGAFVKLEPGVEGLVHISELSHKRVFRTSDVVSEGQEVEVKIMSVDPEAQRISLSMRALQTRPETEKEKQAREEEEAAEAAAETAGTAPPVKKSNKALKGGLASDSEGAKFGLKW